VNGKRYVGKTVLTVISRWSTHVSHATKRRNSSMALHHAIRKYGADNFLVETVCVSKEHLLCGLERFFIREFGTRIENGSGYNMTEGGDGASGCQPNELTRVRMSLSLIGNKRGTGHIITPEERNKINEGIRNRVFTPEDRQYLSDRERKKWDKTCRNGHTRTPENTIVYVKESNGRETRECQDCRKESPSRQKSPKPEPTGKCHKELHPQNDFNTAVYLGKDGFNRTRCKDCDRERRKK